MISFRPLDIFLGSRYAQLWVFSAGDPERWTFGITLGRVMVSVWAYPARSSVGWNWWGCSGHVFGGGISLSLGRFGIQWRPPEKVHAVQAAAKG